MPNHHKDLQYPSAYRRMREPLIELLKKMCLCDECVSQRNRTIWRLVNITTQKMCLNK